MKKQCINCEFYTPKGCVRNPPTIGKYGLPAWPHPEQTDWYGEFKESESAKPQRESELVKLAEKLRQHRKNWIDYITGGAEVHAKYSYDDLCIKVLELLADTLEEINKR